MLNVNLSVEIGQESRGPKSRQLVGQARGLSQAMYSIFDEMRSLGFLKQYTILARNDDIEWGYRYFHIAAKVNSQDYIAAKEKVGFSSKASQEAPPDDFAVERLVRRKERTEF
jgi:hypothetical protein